MLSLQSKLISTIKSTLNPVNTVSARYFSPKSHPYDDGTYRGERPLRHGYEAHHQTHGALPRLRIKEARLPVMPITAKESEWSPRLANMGKNDFLSIMGNDEHFQQHELLTHIPDWLRGYKNTGFEYSVLMRKRKEFDYWRYTKPLKWKHLQDRILFLYKRINNKYKPPKVELLLKRRA